MSFSPPLLAVTFGQIVLVGLVAALGFYVFALRSVLTDRLAMLILAAVGVLLVVWPGLSSDVAERLGIGRGTDLVFYLFIIFCLFRFVSGAAHTRRLESRLATVVRDGAIRDARPAAAAGSSEADETPQA